MAETESFEPGIRRLRPDEVIVLVDGSYLLHRAIYSVGGYVLSERNVPGCVSNCIKTIFSMCKHTHPSRIFWFWDTGINKHRLEIFPEYKQRKRGTVLQEAKSEEEHQRIQSEIAEEEKHREFFSSGQNILDSIFEYFSIHKMYAFEEADDIIAYLSINCVPEVTIIICSDDRDFVQLVRDNVLIYSPRNMQLYSLENIKAFCEWTPQEIVLAKSILGDKSDNIPSACKGLGPVGLRRLFKQMKEYTLEELLDKAKNLGKKYELLLLEETQKAIRRNMLLIDYSRVTLTDEQYASICSLWNQKLQFDIVNCAKVLSHLGLFQMIHSLGTWAKYLERVY